MVSSGLHLTRTWKDGRQEEEGEERLDGRTRARQEVPHLLCSLYLPCMQKGGIRGSKTQSRGKLRTFFPRRSLHTTSIMAPLHNLLAFTRFTPCCTLRPPDRELDRSDVDAGVFRIRDFYSRRPPTFRTRVSRGGFCSGVGAPSAFVTRGPCLQHALAFDLSKGRPRKRIRLRVSEGFSRGTGGGDSVCRRSSSHDGRGCLWAPRGGIQDG